MIRAAIFAATFAMIAWGSLCDAIPGVSVWRSGFAVAVPIVVAIWLNAKIRKGALS